MDPTSPIGQMINCLTEDEDSRQELWVHYLSGNSTNTFSSFLEEINLESKLNRELEHRLFSLMQHSHVGAIRPIVELFSKYEQSIICLLLLGLTVDQISEIKGISQVRIRQSIAAIRYNPYWKKQYGIKKEPNRRRKTRSN